MAASQKTAQRCRASPFPASRSKQSGIVPPAEIEGPVAGGCRRMASNAILRATTSGGRNFYPFRCSLTSGKTDREGGGKLCDHDVMPVIGLRAEVLRRCGTPSGWADEARFERGIPPDPAMDRRTSPECRASCQRSRSLDRWDGRWPLPRRLLPWNVAFVLQFPRRAGLRKEATVNWDDQIRRCGQ